MNKDFGLNKIVNSLYSSKNQLSFQLWPLVP